MKILNYIQLRDMVGLSRATIWRMERRDEFPRRLNLGGRVGWREDEVLAWLDARPRGPGRRVLHEAAIGASRRSGRTSEA